MDLAMMGAATHNGRNHGDAAMPTADKQPFDPNASATTRKLLPFIVFRGKVIDRKLGLSVPTTTIGSDPGCDIVLDDAGVLPRWGVVMRRGDGVFVQHAGGFPVGLEAGEGFVIGPFTVVRADLGTDLGRLWKAAEPGVEVQSAEGAKPLYRQIVVLGGADMGARGPRISHGEAVASTLVPSRLATFPLEKRLSERARDAFDAISRSVSRAAADPALVPDADPTLRALETLAYAEVIAVLEQLASAKAEGLGQLDVYFRRFLLTEPVMAYRLRTLLRQKLAAEARGTAEKVQLPALPLNLNLHVPAEVIARFHDATAAMEKLVDEAIW